MRLSSISCSPEHLRRIQGVHGGKIYPDHPVSLELLIDPFFKTIAVDYWRLPLEASDQQEPSGDRGIKRLVPPPSGAAAAADKNRLESVSSSDI
jgi:hypothetical protein